MTLFVDTGAWMALSYRRDDHHAEAVRFAEREFASARLVTSEAVLGETVTLMRFRLGHAAALGFIDSLADVPADIVFTDAALRSDALDIFRKAGDQSFSYVDCLSFAIMRNRSIREAFAFDADFARFGFVSRPE